VAGTLWFKREGGWSSITNFTDQEIELPTGELLIASEDISAGKLPANSTVWLKLS
jgi:alpha-glucosidase